MKRVTVFCLAASLLLSSPVQSAGCKGAQLAGEWLITITRLRNPNVGACNMQISKRGVVTSISCVMLGDNSIVDADSNNLFVGPNCTLAGSILWPSGEETTLLASLNKSKDVFNGTFISILDKNNDIGTIVGVRK